MEFNKNKIIFTVIGVIILLSIIFLLVTMNSVDNSNNTKNGTDEFKIWIVGDKIESLNDFIEGFKKIYPAYKNKQIIVEAFNSYEDYTYTLMSALSSGNGPDLFVLNNSEKKSVFSDQVLGLDPNIINPNDFRKKYKGVFGDDLISVYTDESNVSKEYVIGLPVGYETLGIYYNRRYVKSTDLDNISTMNNVISDLKNKYDDLIPIGIGNGSTVLNASDIITQFFMLEGGVTGLGNLNTNVFKSAFGAYLLYGDTTGYNGYNERYQELKDTKRNSIYLFSRGEVLMIVGFPSMVKDIKESGFSKSMLQAVPFPHYFSAGGKTLINYNYFVINKDTQNLDLANAFISYLYSDAGASSYLSYFTYYLPALLSLESEKLDQKIDPDFNVILRDFYNDSYELSSFDKAIKNIYDREIISLLDNIIISEQNFNSFKDSLFCKFNKLSTFSDLSANCENK
ncbi:MAG: ABC transporter substrate-binding protein [Candidatus Gracilibacteria bacterium]|nr:ABC transporter substrate-binding protein [Candidatus Gracilibacteria bacterium]